MMKMTPLLMTAVFVGMCFTGLAQAMPVTGWVTTNGDAGFTGGSQSTNSPVTNDASNDVIAANFDALTLANDGEFISLTGSVTVDTTMAANEFRWGIFSSDGPVTPGDGSGYAGFYAGNQADGAAGTVRRRPLGATNPFSSGGAPQVGTTPIILTAGNDVPASTTLSYELTITYDDGLVDIFVSLDDGAAYNPTATIEDQAAPTFEFDSVAFLLGGGLNGDEASFSNVVITSNIPEPGSLILIGLGSGLLMMRRHATHA